MEDDTTMPETTASYEVENFVDPQPLFEALERKDDGAIWAAESTSPSQQHFFERLRETVGHTTYETGASRAFKPKLRHHCSMLMVPTLMNHATASTLTGKATQGPLKTVVNWLTEWMDLRYSITSFQVPLHYQEICMWGPSVMRSRLDQLIKKNAGSVGLEPDFNFQLPEDAPNLSFLVTAVHSTMEWASLPAENAQGDLELTSKISGALQYCAGSPADIQVLTPNFSAEAIRTGLIGWMSALHSQCGIGKWDVTPVAQDMVILHLEVGDQGAMSQIPLRAHQIGLDGIQDVLTHVATIGACASGAKH